MAFLKRRSSHTSRDFREGQKLFQEIGWNFTLSFVKCL